ncbi:MAG TPA: dCTP deaminase, partial [Dehalococcoidia bacterium]|nr:dCTP deaminase [Dehalococcoidia bacterium]
MILSDRDIRRYLAEGKIRVDPAPDLEEQLGSCSLDFRLGNVFQVFELARVPYVDPTKDTHTEQFMRRIDVPDGEPFIIQPGELVLATTREYFEISNDLVARLEGRSSLGRLGIIVHGTASIFDPGWSGAAVLELGNLGRMAVALYPGMRVCAFTFEQLSSPSENPYRQKARNKY